MRLAQFLVVIASLSLSAAWGAEFRSVNVGAAILYDAPSFKATRVFIISKFYPLEIISRAGEWAKVRDAGGDFSWISASALSDKRTVMVTAPSADIREAAHDNATIIFRAEKNVVLDLLEPPASTWIKVRHRDGATGYVKLDQIWGI